MHDQPEENYRLRDLVYPFARAECEPPSAAGGPAPEFPDILEVRTRRQADIEALAERILDAWPRPTSR